MNKRSPSCLVFADEKLKNNIKVIEHISSLAALFSRSNHIPDLNYVCNLRQHRPEVVFLLIFEQQKIHQNSGNVFRGEKHNKVVKLSTFFARS